MAQEHSPGDPGCGRIGRFSPGDTNGWDHQLATGSTRGNAWLVGDHSLRIAGRVHRCLVRPAYGCIDATGGGGSVMAKVLQSILLAVGIVGLLGLLTEIGLAVAAAIPGSTPARVVQVTAGPYPLTLRLYKDPASAGVVLPFASVPTQATERQLSFDATSIPAKGVDATPVHDSLSPDPSTGGVQGTAEITVQGTWYLHVVVSGLVGKGTVDVPVSAVAPPALPQWLGWSIGFLSLYGLLVFLLLQRSRKKTPWQHAGREKEPVPG